MLKESDKIIFFGDSITELGSKPKGYVALIKKAIADKYPSIEIINAGISGNKVTDLQKRVDKDVVALNPTVVFIYIGINDVWHSILQDHRGTPKDVYESGLQELIVKIKNTGAHVILCTPSVIGEKADGTNQLDNELDEYSEVSRRIAGTTGAGLLDLRKVFIKYLKENNPANKESKILTLDGVHLSHMGNKLVAQEMLMVIERYL